jgi:hypothetical protein
LRPRSRSSWLMPRQSSAENNVDIPNLQGSQNAGALPVCRKMFYSTRRSVIEKMNDRET